MPKSPSPAVPIALAFGHAVRRLREDAGYSRLAFAHRAGISRTYGGELERGEKSPTLDVVQRIAETLGLSYAELFAHVDEEMRVRGQSAARPARKAPR